MRLANLIVLSYESRCLGLISMDVVFFIVDYATLGFHRLGNLIHLLRWPTRYLTTHRSTRTTKHSLSIKTLPLHLHSQEVRSLLRSSQQVPGARIDPDGRCPRVCLYSSHSPSYGSLWWYNIYRYQSLWAVRTRLDNPYRSNISVDIEWRDFLIIQHLALHLGQSNLDVDIGFQIPSGRLFHVF